MLFGYLFKDIKIDSKTHSSYFFLFTIRRLIYCYIGFGMGDYPSIQRLILSYMNLAMFLFTGNKFLKTRRMNRFEILNEVIVCWSTLSLAFFSDWILDFEIKVKYGWQMITII
jgi:hypothetical protein